MLNKEITKIKKNNEKMEIDYGTSPLMVIVP